MKEEKLAADSSNQKVGLTKESDHTDPRDNSTVKMMESLPQVDVILQMMQCLGR